ncbi:uncharacterized protein LOC123310056 isoform X2 [Coccinella septempunctata]|uniref:uncharacterized protein LOC123310056 isoform X2 n=1 Tax=Coccinella septempunctata TaxID=41139 RepID=UPI001D079ABD|nr:uncharacterized protein LOC123310056 isoform X2 [Coccinella septempunctata]
MRWGGIVVMVWIVPFCLNVRNNGTILDFAELQSTIQTDKLNHKNDSYKFEDFFWTGSGDGPYDKDDEPWVIEPPTTVIYTSTATVTTTIYTASGDNNDKKSSAPKCVDDCGSKGKTPTSEKPDEPPDSDNLIDADKEFWIVTVIKTDGKDPELIDLKNRLVKLYKKAFQRQQERHLGLGYKRRRRKAVVDKPVNVYIHQVDPKNLDGNREIEVLYHVAVSGKPVSALTAVADMSLISDEEVRQELGFPTLIKAEPYLKPTKAQSLSRAKNTWIVIGGSIISFLVLLLLIAFLTLGCTKRKRSQEAGIDNRRQIFERAVEDVDNSRPKSDGFTKKPDEHSPTYINFQNQPSTESLNSGISRKSAAYLSPSTSSSTSLDISPLMTVKKSTPPKKPPRPRAALNKTVPVNVVKIPQDVYDSDSNTSRRNSVDTIFVENNDPGVSSPKSYLSMPSIKSFPRINNPEPLNKVLEPVSMLHLDMPEEAEVEITHIPYPKFARHGSVGTNADPGVIGPVVWDIHCKRLQHGMSMDEGIDDLTKTPRNITRMRKRFNELLDDTFSLFGSRIDGADEETRKNIVEVKSKSANVDVQRGAERFSPFLKPRPKTSGPVKPEKAAVKPRGAWTSSTTSPLVRPVSAGIVAPKVNVEHIQAEGKFRESDPAIPLIAAIKTELEKCSLPGSTTDLNDK